MTGKRSGGATRRDGIRNRERLVAAAAAAFREHGLSASVNAIAERAGVNVATLYRHFPAKEHLIEAALDAVLEPLALARDHALATERPGAALRTFFQEAVLVQGVHRGLADALAQGGEGVDVRRRLRGPAVEIVAPLVERAHRDGELRQELGEIELLVALRMLSAVADAAERGYGGAEALVDVVVRGLRPDPPPGAAGRSGPEV